MFGELFNGVASTTDVFLPFIGIVIALTGYIFLRSIITSIANGVQFRTRGFRPFQRILVDEKDAVIVQLGLTQATIMKLNGGDSWEFVSIPNTRLPLTKFAHKIERYNKDTH